MAAEVRIRALIVDDEAPARSRIRQLLKNEAGFEIVADCSNGRQAVETIRRERPDLVFLDVQMPGLTGLEVCETLSADNVALPLVIFVTAYDQYALKAFDVHAIDYLLKPFDRERFQKALGHVREQLTRLKVGASDPRLNALLEDLRAGAKKTDRLVFKENGRVIFLQTQTIDWIEADGNYIRLHAGSESHYVRETLAGMEAQLPSDGFMRISRSLLVNLDRIKELQPLFYGDYVVILRDGSKLNMSRNYRDRLESILARRS
jgi:two-component system, LytTR family, response regulator